MRRVSLVLATLVLVFGVASMPRHLISRTATSSDFVHFESQQIHPAVLTPSQDRLLVVNTPDAHLVVFDVTGSSPNRIADIAVGLEPVSVACLNDSVAWVVNNLSDDVSIVNLNTMHSEMALRVGDEPNDVVFAGTPARAYVSVSNEDVVKVYDPATRALVATIPIAGRSPRALARDASGAHVYAAIFHGNNATSILAATKVPDDSIPQDVDFPRDSIPGHGMPKTGFIIQQQNGNWFDYYGNLWNSKAKYSIQDVDVAEIATASNTVSRNFGNIGSACLNIAVNATDGRIAVAALNARNTERFEERVQGYVVETRASFVTQTGTVLDRVLNPHIHYDVVPGTQAEADSALGTPTEIAYSSNGLRAYVTALADDKIGVLNPYGLGTSGNPVVLARVKCVAGPSGLVVDDARGRIYVVGRYYNQLQTLSTTDFSVVALDRLGMNPTPDDIVNGRKFFYGGFTSAHGDQSCASCHLFGDMDNQAWDLGNPSGGYVPPPSPNPLGLRGFDPMKGPMVTQTLRGLTNTEPFHWRGDRANLAAFNPAFVSLMGRTDALPDSEMSAFSDFVMAMVNPPNPNEYLDRSQPDAPPGSPSSMRGQNDFINTAIDGPLRCNDCHTENNFGPGTNRQMVPAAALMASQDMKIPQLRNEYRKTGFHDTTGAVNRRGYGYTHDGALDNLDDFLHFPRFNFTDEDQRRDMAAYLLSFDTGTAPAVGFQITFDGPNDTDPTAIAEMDTLEGQAALNYCDLIAKGRVNGQPRGWEYVGGLWQPDKQNDVPITSEALRALGEKGAEITVTGVPKGSGHRMGVDRDRDGALDGDELDSLSDPGNPASTPGNVGVPGVPNPFHFGIRAVRPNPFRDAMEVEFTLGRRSPVTVAVYDVLGRQVQSVARGVWMEAGPQSLRWDGRAASGARVSAGVYFVRLETAGGNWTRPVIRIR
ncbi:MAG TPA: FlgD immunoglobulin-like domain containing protein [Candidatus Udaeobacter sp.]|jgi:DNA-binding beta-propeller fold protein YncE|nr:FlgD immunoglobulin-like domain containing protein [Candidatus Udaeobacter sp.]